MPANNNKAVSIAKFPEAFPTMPCHINNNPKIIPIGTAKKLKK